jgi:hypothetical protein
MTLLVLVDNVERTEHHLQSVRRSPVNIVGQACSNRHGRPQASTRGARQFAGRRLTFVGVDYV